MIREYFQAEFPRLTVHEMAKLEGLAPSTVYRVAAEMQIDLNLYNQRRRRVQKYILLEEQMRTLRQQIHTPIKKKEQ